jgi:hypothetical protein
MAASCVAKATGIGERRQVTEEAEISGSEGHCQPLEKQPPEEPRERLDRQEEPRPPCDPA